MTLLQPVKKVQLIWTFLHIWMGNEMQVWYNKGNNKAESGV